MGCPLICRGERDVVVDKSSRILWLLFDDLFH